MENLSLIQKIVVYAPPVLLAITVHEAAHGFVASKLGDPTAKMLGRVTLNPIKHIDPIGTVLLPLLMMWQTNFLFGWAKPVPITWSNLKNPKKDMVLVALAGPGSNFLMAICWAIILKIGLLLGNEQVWVAEPMVWMGSAGIYINSILMVLNLLPLPPLDGGRVLAGLLPGPWAWKFNKIEPYGLFILLALLVTGVLQSILSGPINGFGRLLHYLIGL